MATSLGNVIETSSLEAALVQATSSPGALTEQLTVLEKAPAPAAPAPLRVRHLLVHPATPEDRLRAVARVLGDWLQAQPAPGDPGGDHLLLCAVVRALRAPPAGAMAVLAKEGALAGQLPVAALNNTQTVV